MIRVWGYLSEYSLLLVFGSLLALFWANTDPASYHAFVEVEFLHNLWVGHAHVLADGKVERVLTLHYLVNDVLMAVFFAFAGKEVWEAVALREGSLRGRRAMTPLVATAGGMIGPVAVYLALAALMGSETYDAIARGWAIPTATDIAFSYLVGRLVFGAGHPAVRFLLLLAIADDAAGLLILAVFYPTGALAPAWLLLSLAAAVAAWGLGFALPRWLDRGNPAQPASSWVRQRLGLLPYAVAGAVSWFAFQESGLHPALGLLPIIPAIPHADRDFGVYAEEEAHATDLLNRFEHLMRVPVDVILFLFGLCNAGVEFGAIGAATWVVMAGLLIGKPLGILGFGWVAARPLGLGLPQGMRVIDLLVVGAVAAIGFTVALFVATVAFRLTPGAAPEVLAAQQAVQDAAKMGALFSFAAVGLAFLLGRLCRVERVTGR